MKHTKKKRLNGIVLFFKKNLYTATLLMFLGMVVSLSPAPAPAQAETLNMACTAWGCTEFKKSADEWAQKTGNTVHLYENGRLADNLLGLYRQVLAAESDEFDFFLVDTIWPGVLSKHLIDLRRYIPEKVIKQYFQPIVENLTDSDGRLVSMPLFTDTGLLYYRKDLLEKYEMQPPTTWEEMEKIANRIVMLEKINNPNLVGFVWQGKAYEGLTCNALEWIDSYRGGTIIDQHSGEITINNSKALQALKMARTWIGTISPPEVLEYTEMETNEHFRSGNAVFMRHWLEAWATTNDEKSPVKGQVGVVALPKGTSKGKHSGVLGDMSFAVSKYSKNPALAAELVVYLAGYNAQKKHAIKHSFSPTLVALYEDPDVVKSRPFMAALKTGLLNGVARPSKITGSSYPKISKKFSTSVHAILSKQKNPEQALQDLEQSLSKIKRRTDW